jgi:hypothetical protein
LLLAATPALLRLYAWEREPAAPAVLAKGSFFHAPFFIGRMVVIVAAWSLLTILLLRASRAQDADRDVRHTRATVALSAVFLIVGGWTFCLASVDWLMSLEPAWASTIFGFYNLGGLLASSVAAIAVAVIALRRHGLLPWINENHIHDLGKLLFAMSIFWAYLWFSQYLLIWYANLPAETSYFLARTRNGWAATFYLNLVVNWLIPFAVLLPRPAKRSEQRVLAISVLVLGGHWLDVYLMTAPANFPTRPLVGIPDLMPLVFMGSLFIAVFLWALRRAPLLAAGDPYLVESLHHHQ